MRRAGGRPSRRRARGRAARRRPRWRRTRCCRRIGRTPAPGPGSTPGPRRKWSSIRPADPPAGGPLPPRPAQPCRSGRPTRTPPCSGSRPAASTCAAHLRARPARRGPRPGPSSASGSPSTSTASTPSRSRNSSSPGSPCSVSELALLHLADLGLLARLHHLLGQLPLERGLDRGDERRRVLVAPRRVLAERLAVPVLEVDEAGLGDERRRRRRRPSGGGTGWRRSARARPDRRRGSSAPAWSRRAGAVNCTNGGWLTRRGAGTPVRPPAVCTKRTQPSPTSGSGRMSGSGTAAKRRRLRAEPHRGRADVARRRPGRSRRSCRPRPRSRPRAGWRSGTGRPSRSASRSSDHLGRGVVVVGHARLERAASSSR